MPSTVPSDPLSSPPASDLAAARDRLETLADALEEMLITYQNPRTDAMRRVQDAAAIRTVLSSLGDGDDSARLDFIEQSGQAIRVLPLHEHPHRYVVIDDTLAAVASPVPSWYGDTLRDAIDAARTAPGGASNG